MGEFGGGVPGARCREEGWGRLGEGSRELGARRKGVGGRGEVPGAGCREEGWGRSGRGVCVLSKANKR